MPTPGQYCFLCASDEGVFLDIAGDNRATICKQLEDCSLDPELAGSVSETLRKICHKCAYELEQCSSFVSNLKRALKAKNKSKVANKICGLCLESGNKSYLFHLEEDNCSVQTTIFKIKSFLNHDVYEDDNRLICLSCKYKLDVLYDIKSIYQNNLPRLQNITNEDLNYSLFPKTRTRVVNRKTTITESDSISAISISSSDSDSNIMPRKKQSRTKVPSSESLPGSNLQSCDECHNTYKSGTDVYRIHKTGHTICKKCWMSPEPGGQKSKNMKTKVCSVFVKDVLRDSTYTKDKIYKVEEDSDGNKTYIVKEPEKKGKVAVSQRKVKRTASLDVPSTIEKRVTRGAKTSAESTDNDEKTTKKVEPPKNGNISKVHSNEKLPAKRTRNQTIIAAGTTNVIKKLRTRKNELKLEASSRKAISDTEQVKTQRRSLRKTKRTLASKTDVSEESANEGVSTRKRRKIIKAETTKNGQDVLKKTAEADSSNSDIEVISVTDVSDEINEVESKAEVMEVLTEVEDEPLKPRRAKRTQSVEPPAVTPKEKVKSRTPPKKDVETKGRRSNSVSSSETVEVKTKRTRSSAVSNDVVEVERKKRRENTPPSQEEQPETVDITESPNGEEPIVLEDDKPHTCKVCEKIFDSRLVGLTHELTHHKKLEVKLHRRELTEVDSEVKDEADDKVVPAETEEASENIAIRIDDDEEPQPVEDVSTASEKVDVDPSDEAKAPDDLPHEIPASPAKKDANDTEDQADKSPKKTDTVQNTCTESSETKTAEVSEDSTKETPNSDAITEGSKDNKTVIEEEDSNKEPELPEETKESSDSAEKDKQSDSVQPDKPEDEVDETKENNTVDKTESDVEESGDVPTGSPPKNATEDEAKTPEKSKDTQTVDEEPKSKADTPTKTDKTLENNTENDEHEPSKTADASPDKVEDEVQAEAEKESNEAKTVKKDSCEITTHKTAVTEALQLLEENGAKVNTNSDAPESQSEKIATEVLQEVFDLAAAEVQKRQDSSPNSETIRQEDVETLENISREIQNSGDLKSLDTESKNESDTTGNEVSLE